MTDIDTPKPTLSELAQQEATLKALLDTVKATYNEVREQTQEALEYLNATAGADRMNVTLPGPSGEVIAVISLTNPEPVPAIEDPEAFLAWVMEHAGTEIVRKWVKEVRPAFVAKLFKDITDRGVVAEDGTVTLVDTDTGVVLPVAGVKVSVRSAKTHSVRFKAKGRKAVADAWEAGHLKDLPLFGRKQIQP